MFAGTKNNWYYKNTNEIKQEKIINRKLTSYYYGTFCGFCYVSVAQWTEQGASIAKVEGSSPSGDTLSKYPILFVGVYPQMSFILLLFAFSKCGSIMRSNHSSYAHVPSRGEW